jgi:putative ABC transport system permease protein
MIKLRLALRNLFRSPRRTILSMVAVVFGIGVFILGEGFISGVEENIKAASIQGMNGHVLARPAGYPRTGLQHPVDELLTIDDGTRRLLDERTEAWTERIVFSPTAASAEDHIRVRAIGYDPARDPGVFPRRLWRLDGEEPDAGRDEVLITGGVARLLGLGPGDTFVLQVRTHMGAVNALQVTVAGIVATGLTNIDLVGVLVPMPLAQRLIAAAAPTHIAVRLASRDTAPAFKTILETALGPQAEIITWQEDTRDLLALQSIRRRALQFVVVILLVLAGFGTANTILMAAHERVREIGTLRSMGMTVGGVVGLFVIEGLIMGTASSVLGALWGGAMTAWWAANPIDMSDLLSDLGGANMAISALVYTRFSRTVIVFGVAFGVAVSVLASLYPARVASRMPPAEAVRAE